MATASAIAGILQVNSSGTVDALALTVYSGQVLAAFNKAIVTGGKVVERNITSGKTAQFPVIGRTSSAFHTRGEEIAFSALNNNERTISIQDLLMSNIFVDVLDEAKSHFETRSEMAVQQGQELAEQDDLRKFLTMITASRTATPNFTGGDAGAPITGATMATDAAVLKAAIYDAAEGLDEHSIPNSDRSLFVAPAQFYLLLQDGEFLDRDFGGDGSRATAVMRNAADFTVIKTNNLPSTDLTSDTDFPSGLRDDYTTTVAVASHKSAGGCVSLIGLQFESEWDMNRQGHMFIAKYAKGYGILRPESAFELATA